MGGHARGTYPVRGGDGVYRRIRRDGSEELIPDLADPSHDIIIPVKWQRCSGPPSCDG
jgi:hypothetical protein